MKVANDPKAAAWGVVIGVTAVAVGVVWGLGFPHYHVPPTLAFVLRWDVLAALACGGVIIASYRKLWGKPGLWAMALALTVGNVFLFSYLDRGLLGPPIVSGPLAFGAEFAVFQAIVHRVYHVMADVNSWAGR